MTPSCCYVISFYDSKIFQLGIFSGYSFLFPDLFKFQHFYQLLTLHQWYPSNPFGCILTSTDAPLFLTFIFFCSFHCSSFNALLSNLSALNCFSGSFIFNTITHSMIRSLMARWLNLVYDALYRSKTIALSQIQIHVLWTHLKSLLAHYFLRSSFFSFLLSYFLTMLVSVFTSRTVSINEFVVFISSASGISQILVFCAALVSKKCFSYVSTYKLQ